MTKQRRSSQAVSEVLDIVLLLGIAMALFAILYFVVFSYPFSPQTPSVHLLGTVNGNNITIANLGGKSLSLDTEVFLTIDGNPISVKVGDESYLRDTNHNHLWDIGEEFVYSKTDISNLEVRAMVVDKASNSIIMTGLLQEGNAPSGSPFTLTVTIVGSGTVTKKPNQGTYQYNDVVILTANPASGWYFDHWSGDLTGNTNPTTIRINGNKAVTATFTRNKYTLTVNIIGSGSVTLNPPGGTYDYGTTVTLTATANTGYTFTGWSGDLTGNTNPTTITINGNKAVTATFKQMCILRPNAAGSTTQLMRNGGSANWDRVDEVTEDESTTYVYGTGDDSWQTDTYNVPDQSLTGTITNVRIYIRALESTSRPSDTYGRTAIRIGTGSIQYGTQLDLTTSWTNYYTDYATKTGTLGSGAWTWADINNLQIGVSLQSHMSSGSTWRYAECTQVWVEVTYTP
jgi:uncharacterized repeat protein (TIGR02543 family)